MPDHEKLEGAQTEASEVAQDVADSGVDEEAPGEVQEQAGDDPGVCPGVVLVAPALTDDLRDIGGSHR
jgi:hypothetical protein